MNATLETAVLCDDQKKKDIERATEVIAIIPKDAREKALYFLEGMAAAFSQQTPKASV